MIVAVDNRLALKESSGMGVYLNNMLPLIAKFKGVRLQLFSSSWKEQSLLSKILGQIREQLWVQIILPSLAKDSDLIYSPNPPSPFFFGKRIVLTIPDMSFYFDEEINFLVKAYLYLIYLLSAHRARLITTFSENSKKDIQRLILVNPRKVKVVSPGFGQKKPLLVNKLDLKKYGISKKFILSTPGTFLKRKNPDDLARAFSLLPKRVKDKYQLVFVGNNADPNYTRFLQLVEQLGISSQMVFTGYITYNDLYSLYKEAEMFIYPSLYEGFGLPPLEAQSCGTPVVVYNRSSLMEIVGDSALIVENVNGLKQAMIDLSSQAKLRKQLIDRGYKNVDRFSWPKSSDKLIEVFKEAYAK